MRTSTIGAGWLLAILALVGCTPAVALQPADDATNPSCADVIVRLPDTVAGLDARETNAQATGAWGTPAEVLLRCGVPVPDPTSTLSCVEVDGVNWLRDSSGDPNFVFTSYGRDPATEVIINGETVSGLTVLTDLASAIGVIPATGACVALDDVLAPPPQ